MHIEGPEWVTFIQPTESVTIFATGAVFDPLFWEDIRTGVVEIVVAFVPKRLNRTSGYNSLAPRLRGRCGLFRVCTVTVPVGH